MFAIPRYSSTCCGEVFSHAANVERCMASGLPSRFATNHSAASRAMVVLTLSLALIASSQPCHAAAAVCQSLTQVLFDHVRRDAQLQRYLLVAHAMPIVQGNCGLRLGGQLTQHLVQPLDTSFRVDLCARGGQV